ncbi:sporulation protein YunB [Thermoanaerobacter kivui]|uniref:Sporulation protein YunB n=1 Tax=Thermoanaerobacter kivui TaxID=2325 RepID=A0A097ASE2_THEKI|nr:sporulation protein YunB [Thermoanaerobacter kivui]AIS52740.1 sporulation protein YunB [Thermoanaerobacter kivui]
MRRKKWGSRRTNSFYIYLLYAAIVLLIFYYFTEYRLKPAIIAVSDTLARETAVNTINNAINEKVLKGIEYKDLIYVRTDNNGKISMLQANTIEMNLLASKVTKEVKENLNNLGPLYAKIPLGSVFSTDLFANAGPKIKVGLLPVGAVDVDFSSQFEPAGINQTRHRIYLDIQTTIRIIAPLASDKITVTLHMPIAESIIVGDVPNSYVDVNGDKYTVPVPSESGSKINIQK